MGATCLVHWKDANGQQSLTLLSDRLLKQFHASPIGRWTINWKVFRDTSPVSKSGTGKMMHVVHVQGGATARGVPPGSQASSAFTGGIATAAGAAVGVGGVGSTGVGALVSGPSGMALSSGGMTGNAVNTGQVKPVLGILPPGGGPVGTGSISIGSGAGGVGVTGPGQAAVDAYNSTAWCLIDDGAVGASGTLTTSAATSVASTPISSTGADNTVTPKRKAVLVEVEKDIEALIAKLKNLWVHRQHAQVEGHIFDLGDFIVRAGNIMVASTSYKGMLIEVSGYLPTFMVLSFCCNFCSY
ncbi:hypothetical protein BGZ51_007429 [Haplosporangium sp. Z 767]|nr:hypothetical protein BGZ51_007429 [Haplosporangium sp. Z 767]